MNVVLNLIMNESMGKFMQRLTVKKTKDASKLHWKLPSLKVSRGLKETMGQLFQEENEISFFIPFHDFHNFIGPSQTFDI